jgi:peroxiredoxin (alkyl hydroperoxide reductase subunit C)
VSEGIIAPGTQMPELKLRRADFSKFTNADFEGKTTVLVFYPYAFSDVCTDQFNLYDEVLEEFAAQGATLYGVSCDSPISQNAFKEKLGVRIEQLSDWEPKGAVCGALGVMHAAGMPQRALVIVGPNGVVKWSYLAASPGDLPGANLIFDGLAA